MIIWVTGLPGSGKTTFASELSKMLKNNGVTPVTLDGDELRQALNNFSYDSTDRLALAKTYSKLAKLMSDQGHVVIVATVSLFNEVQLWNRKNNNCYIEVLISPSFDTLKGRNQKGLYDNYDSLDAIIKCKKMSSEFPDKPDFIIQDDTKNSLKDNIKAVYKEIKKRTNNV
ncbi:adenylyl-sulfate kinase [Pseudoalteromonas sp. L23]|uniref:adenylyl-sulfate kinase n=1 Tax=unclassified Pseudoalteromonas TaxID=194690 RepID=UPI001EEFB071|nr:MULTISPECIES: adenylyl-sulfate kinase [unclassified Pseudoalteromonas]MCF7514997.1 adenylyl-sulfate kinase [Pseudoalteromonas sp. L7]MCF7527079.1 adenylyl-sulfate kinase [Pseudoalteromonas sp. L23]MCX2767487.1 adenylyl-sulfate kinase [Pseudoalteromonas sp. B530]